MRGGGWVGTTGTSGPIDVVGMRRAHNKWVVEHEAMLLKTALEIGGSAAYFARTTKLVKRRSGTMADGWRKGITRSRSVIRVSLISRVPHAYWQEKGTGIYGPRGMRIFPRVAKFLRWQDPDTGQIRFARSVRGTPAKWIGKRSTFEAWGFGKSKLSREASRLAGKF